MTDRQRDRGRDKERKKDRTTYTPPKTQATVQLVVL